MQCKFCGADIPEEAAVCSNCGAPVQTPEENEMPEQEETAGEDETSGNEQMNGGVYSYQQDFEQNYNQRYNQNYNQNDEQHKNPVNSTPYMIFAVFTTLMCCLPFGIAAVVYASRINSLQRMGDFAGAGKAAKKAKTFSIISAVMTLIAMIGYGVFFAVLPDNEKFESGVKNTEIQFPGDDKPDTDEEATDKVEVGDQESTKEEQVQISDDLGKSWDSYTFQLGAIVLKLPGKLQDIEAAGFKVDDASITDDYVVEPNKLKSIFVKNDKGVSVKVDLSNDTNEIQKIADCKVSGVCVEEYRVENREFSVAFPGSVRIGTSEKELLDVYGKPSEEYEGESAHTYVWHSGDDYSKQCRVEVDAKTKLVTWMSMQYTEH